MRVGQPPCFACVARLVMHLSLLAALLRNRVPRAVVPLVCPRRRRAAHHAPLCRCTFVAELFGCIGNLDARPDHASSLYSLAYSVNGYGLWDSARCVRVRGGPGSSKISQAMASALASSDATRAPVAYLEDSAWGIPAPAAEHRGSARLAGAAPSRGGTVPHRQPVR